VKRVVIAPHVRDYAIRCTLATHPQGQFAIPMVNQFLRVGASPRAAQAIELASKVHYSCVSKILPLQNRV
jgi:MoxR-like ATPase